MHPELWVGANRKWRAVPKDRLTRVEHNKVCIFGSISCVAWSFNAMRLMEFVGLLPKGTWQVGEALKVAGDSLIKELLSLAYGMDDSGHMKAMHVTNTLLPK